MSESQRKKSSWKRCAWLGKGAISVLVLAVVLNSLLEHESKAQLRDQAMSLFVAPIIQTGWKFGLLQNAVFVRIDDTEIRVMRNNPSSSYLKKIQSRPVDSKDIFVVTFPKSGTHLLGQLTLQVIGDGAVDFDSIHEYVSVVEMEAVSPKSPGCPSSIVDYFTIREDKKTDEFVHLTHLTRHHLPYSDDAKYIVMMRHPLDTILSGANMARKFAGPHLAPDVEIMADMMLVGTGRHKWANYYRSWWDMKDQPNVLFLFYEDALKNLTNMVVQVTEFLGKETVPEIVENVRFKSSLDYMKPNAKKFEPPECLKGDNKLDMVNKGKVGRGKSALTEETKAKVRKAFHEAFAESDFPFTRYDF